MLRPSFVPPAGDPGAAGLHPPADRAGRGTLPAQAAPREAARGRADQAVVGGDRPARDVGAGDDRSAHRRRTRPARSSPTWPAGSCNAKRAALLEALNGRFDDHHADLARLLLDQIDACTDKIDRLTARIEQLVAELPDPSPPGRPRTRPTLPSDVPVEADPDARRLSDSGTPRRGARHRRASRADHHRRDRSRHGPVPHPRAPGVLGQAVTPDRSSPARRSQRGKTGKGNRYLKGVLGEVATAAAKTDTFLGERYRRLVRRRGKQRALVAVARSILVIACSPIPPGELDSSSPTGLQCPTRRRGRSGRSGALADERDDLLDEAGHLLVGLLVGVAEEVGEDRQVLEAEQVAVEGDALGDLLGRAERGSSCSRSTRRASGSARAAPACRRRPCSRGSSRTGRGTSRTRRGPASPSRRPSRGCPRCAPR